MNGKNFLLVLEDPFSSKTCFLPLLSVGIRMWELSRFLFLAPLCMLMNFCCCSVAQSCPTLCDPMDCKASLSLTISRSLLKLMSIELVMPSSHLVLCRPLLLLPSICPSIRVFSSESAFQLALNPLILASYLVWSKCSIFASIKNNWCFWTVMLEKTLESPLDCKEIQPVHSKGDQPWDFFGRNDAKAETPVLWPPHVPLVEEWN